MATYKFRLPDIGEGIAEAEVVAWHVKVGDIVQEDAPLADMMTDKATVEMSSPVAGTVIARSGEVGDMVPIGSVLVEFEIEAEVERDAEHSDTSAEGADNAQEVAMPGEEQAEHASPEPTAVPEPRSPPENDVDARPTRVAASPAVRQRAKELGIDLADLPAAAQGRVRHADLDAFLSYNAARGYNAPLAKRSDERIKVIGLRRRIAENMAASKRHIPHFSYIEEVDVTKLEDTRADLNRTRGDKPKLTLLPLLITAICKTLPQFPMINAHFDEEAGVITRFGSVHVGVATQTDGGLMVPVLRDSESRNVWQLAAEILRLAEAARSGKAKPAELTGSSITMTSLGPLGGIATTPVINRPEVAIIGPNKIVERPIVKDGAIVIAKMMNISMSCDHRVVDGWDAANFVQALKRLLETPALLFVD